MSNPPVCHISTGSRVTRQPRATLLPSIPAAVDLPSAIAAINALKLLIQLISGQQTPTGPGGINIPPLGGGVFVVGGPGQDGKKGEDAKEGGRFVEDRRQRVEQKKRIFQGNDKKSENWVDIKQINRCVWVDKVTGETIVWSR